MSPTVPHPPARRPTLEAVAAQAGVSRATVSRVVNGSPQVDPALARKVKAAVAQLGYVPNLSARSLMTRRTDVVALVAAEGDDRVFGDPFFSGIVRGVGHELLVAGRQLMLFMSQGSAELDSVEAFLRGGHCDGVLLISEHGRHGTAAALTSAGIPVVIGGRPLDPTLRIPYVDHDNVAGAFLAARHLTDTAGRTRVATIAGPQDMSAGVDRLLGFSRALGTDYDPALVEHGDFTGISGASAMEQLLSRAPDLDGVFVASDLMALAAIAVLRRHGRRVPDDVAVVGFDDIALAADSTPSLTTIRQRTVEQGRRMAQTLVGLIDARAAQPPDQPVHRAAPDSHDGLLAGEGIVLPVELVVRETA
ncbi:MAG: LacI family DNA-binding transcriptional regulator [Dermatophilaceae bacterium]